MTKLLERDQDEKDKRTYVSMFYLPEKDIQKVVVDRIEIEWDPNRPDNWRAASVFLANVDQDEPFGDRDTGATKSGNRVSCHTFPSVPAVRRDNSRRYHPRARALSGRRRLRQGERIRSDASRCP
jgi:hypothetical protein